MEDRKKTLRDLEASKAQSQEVLDKLLGNLGESLISRNESCPGQNISVESDKDNPFILWQEKKRLDNEVAGAEDNIRTIETDLRRLGELEEEISRKEREKNEKAKEIIPVYTELGRLVMTDSGFDRFSSVYEQEMNDITLKIDYQQKKLDELDNTEGNFFIRVTKGVRGMVNRAILSKNEAELEKLYRLVGEQFLEDLENPQPRRISNEEVKLLEEGIICTQALKGRELRNQQITLNGESEKLRKERREIADALDEKGNPARRISELEVFISNTRDGIQKIYRRFGACARTAEWRVHFSPFTETEIIQDEKIGSITESLCDMEKKIEAVKIAIAIDNENAAIAKLRQSIDDKQRVINEAQTEISELNGQIAAAEKRIGELSEKQHGEEQ